MLPASEHMNRQEKLAVSKAKFITFLRAKDADGRDIYAFYAINGKDADRVNALLKSGEPFDPKLLDKYGTHIHSDYGSPTEDIVEWMEKDYCFNRAVFFSPYAVGNVVFIEK